jgi:hypothetical protein
MQTELPVGFNNKFLCRGCVQRGNVEVDSDNRFWVTCEGEVVEAVKRAEYPSFSQCQRHKTNMSNLGRVPLTNEQLRAVHAYAASLSATDFVERNQLIASFEATLVARES